MEISKFTIIRYTIFLLFVFSCLVSLAQEKITLWPDSKDDFRKKAVEFFHYRADTSAIKRNTAIIFCPGGSYCYLAKKNEGHDPAKLFAKQGFETFVLIYRRGLKGNRYPSQNQDLQQAMIYVREHYSFDSLGVCGFSAGGNVG